MNILITGGAGYIGSHLAEKLINKTDNIFIIDNLSTGHKSLINDQAVFIEGDIKDKNKLADLVKSCHIDTIVHLAACLNVSEAEENKYKYRKNNIEGTKNVLMACRNSNVKNLIFSSSCSIYGNVQGSVNEGSLILKAIMLIQNIFQNDSLESIQIFSNINMGY